MAEIMCRRCNGNGTEELSESYERVLAVLRDAEFGWMSTRAIHDVIGLRRIGHTLLCNRLAYLLKVGLVEKRRSENDPRALDWRMV